MRLSSTVFLIAAVAAVARAESSTRPGEYVVTFAERNALGRMDVQRKRLGWSRRLVAANDPRGGDYDVAKESFRIFVPRVEAPREKAFGLLVWVSAGDHGQVPFDWHPVLRARRVIAIGANASGNDRLVWDRIGLALDAVAGASKLHPIDPARVWVAGYSGGGKVASRLALHYSDVFRGSISMCGTCFYRPVPITGRPRELWPAIVRKPPPRLLGLAKRTHRWVLFTGDEDMNRLSTLDRYRKGFRRDRFRHVLYLEAPDHGHVWADGPWLAKAIAFLDGEEGRAKSEDAGGGNDEGKDGDGDGD